MSGLSRRTFLTRGSVALAVGGAVAAVPGLHSVLDTSTADAAESHPALSHAEVSAATSQGPLVAQVTNVQSGEITVYQGENQVVFKDPGLAARLQRSIQQGK